VYCHLQWDHPSVVMVVYDVTNETSFSSCEKWLEQVLAQKPGVKLPGRFRMQTMKLLFFTVLAVVTDCIVFLVFFLCYIGNS